MRGYSEQLALHYCQKQLVGYTVSFVLLRRERMDEWMGEVDTSYISYNVCLALICRSMGRGQIAGVSAVPETLQTRLVIFIKWKGVNQILRRRKELVIFTR